MLSWGVQGPAAPDSISDTIPDPDGDSVSHADPDTIPDADRDSISHVNPDTIPDADGDSGCYDDTVANADLISDPDPLCLPADGERDRLYGDLYPALFR